MNRNFLKIFQRSFFVRSIIRVSLITWLTTLLRIYTHLPTARTSVISPLIHSLCNILLLLSNLLLKKITELGGAMSYLPWEINILHFALQISEWFLSAFIINMVPEDYWLTGRVNKYYFNILITISLLIISESHALA